MPYEIVQDSRFNSDEGRREVMDSQASGESDQGQQLYAHSGDSNRIKFQPDPEHPGHGIRSSRYSLAVLRMAEVIAITVMPIVATIPATSHSKYFWPATVTTGRTRRTRLPMATTTRSSVGPHTPKDNRNTPIV